MSLNRPVVKFAGNDFNQVPGLLVTRRNDFEAGERVVNQYKLARTDRSVLTTAEFKNKPVVIECTISRSSRALLRDSIDRLNAILGEVEATLDILQDGVTRRYTATMRSVRIVKTEGGYAKIGITFLCSDPFGYDTTATQLLNAVQSSSGNTSFQVAIGGSGAVEPIIIVELVAVAGGTDAVMQITNTQNGIGVTVARSWADGDTLEINGEEKKVRINGSEINYEGKIPSFVPGLRQIGYIDTFDTRTYQITATHTRRYL